ncbi:hypothetical protein BDW62DRAFT_196596 [Aspergillus aurantiobrunneus]
MDTPPFLPDALGRSPAEHLSSLESTRTTATFPSTYPTPTPYAPSAADEQLCQSPCTTTTTSTSTTTTSPPSAGVWPSTEPVGSRMNDPIQEQAPVPPHGPSNVTRPARRVQRCGVGQSRHRPYKATLMEIRCWDHGCEGRKFSSLGNYRRHLREKNGQARVHPCPDCGRVFTRSTARNFHRESGTCGLSPRQLMLQMQMQVQIQAQTAPLSSPLLYSPFPEPSPVLLDSLVDWNTPVDLYSTPGVLLWAGTDGR